MKNYYIPLTPFYNSTMNFVHRSYVAWLLMCACILVLIGLTFFFSKQGQKALVKLSVGIAIFSSFLAIFGVCTKNLIQNPAVSSSVMVGADRQESFYFDVTNTWNIQATSPKDQGILTNYITFDLLQPDNPSGIGMGKVFNAKVNGLDDKCFIQSKKAVVLNTYDFSLLCQEPNYANDKDTTWTEISPRQK